MDRQSIGDTLALVLGAILIGVGFTMRGDLNYTLGTVFVVLGLLMVMVTSLRLYRHSRRKGAFTSDGLDWDFVADRSAEGILLTMVKVTHCESEGPLPLPLTLLVQCSREPEGMTHAYFYPDSRDMTKAARPVPVEVSGKSVYVRLRRPKLRPPAMLSVTLQGIAEEEIESIQRRQ